MFMTRLKTVLLPEPFGPMTPTTVPGATASDRRSTATSPPKRLLRPVISSFAVTPRVAGSLFLPGVGRDLAERSARLFRDALGIDRDLLAVLDLDDDGLDR